MNLIFDLDGVIVDSKKSVELRMQATLEKYGKEREFCVDEFIGRPPEECVEIFFDTNDRELIKKVTKYYLESFEERDMNESWLYPYIKEVLEKLSKDNILYIVTCRPVRHAIMLLHYFGIADLFKNIYGNSLKNSKTKFEILNNFIYAYELAKILKKEDTVYIGDRKDDMEAANKVGIKSVFASWGYASLEEELESKATVWCPGPRFLYHSFNVIKEKIKCLKKNIIKNG